MKLAKKYIQLLILILCISIAPIDIIHANDKSGNKSEFSKKGKFHKAESFNKSDTRAFGPPDPGGGGGDPVPITGGFLAFFIGGLAFTIFKSNSKRINKTK